MGKARDLRRVLEAEDARAHRVVGNLTVPFACIGKGTVPRPKMLARAAAAWREEIPLTGRLMLQSKLTKTSLMIRELRIISAESRLDDWDEEKFEPGFAIVAMQLEVAPPRFRFDPVVLCSVSLHGMARWFQRSFCCTREGLIDNLRPLALAATDERLAIPGDFEVPAGDGRWAGLVLELTDRQPAVRILAVRSFIS